MAQKGVNGHFQKDVLPDEPEIGKRAKRLFLLKEKGVGGY
jgi:hypothetical protein